ncbi:MAG TPA: hypothetical protein VII67_02075 [Acidimicrobiales bacterium]
MGLTGMAFRAIVAAVGAIMYWAVTYQGPGFRLPTVGVFLVIASIAGFVVTSFVSFGAAMKHQATGSTRVCSFKYGLRSSRGRNLVSHFSVTVKDRRERLDDANRPRAWTPSSRATSPNRATNLSIRGVIASLEQKEEDH